MGMDWDPEGDAETRRATRIKWAIVIGVVAAILGVVGSMVHRRMKEKEREDVIRELQSRPRRGY